MLPNIIINYYVLKELICQGKCKKIKLKLKHKYMPDQPTLLTICFFSGKLGQLPPTKFVAKQCFCTHVCHPKGVCLGGGGGSLPTEGPAYGEGKIGQTPPQPEKWEVCIPLECFLVPKNTADMLIQNFHACHFCEGVRNNTST